MKHFTRRDRTYQFCTSGVMLESFLARSEELTHDEVFDILKLVFPPMGLGRLSGLLKSRKWCADLSEKKEPMGLWGSLE